MKKALLLFPIFFILIFPTPTPVQANAPQLFLPVTSYDFGEISEGETIEHIFILKNTGQALLEIISATPDCNCTKVRLSTNRIEAGKQGEITVTYNSQKQRGSFTKLVIIETNDPVEPVKIIKIKGTVIKEDA